MPKNSFRSEVKNASDKLVDDQEENNLYNVVETKVQAKKAKLMRRRNKLHNLYDVNCDLATVAKIGRKLSPGREEVNKHMNTISSRIDDNAGNRRNILIGDTSGEYNPDTYEEVIFGNKVRGFADIAEHTEDIDSAYDIEKYKFGILQSTGTVKESFEMYYGSECASIPAISRGTNGDSNFANIEYRKNKEFGEPVDSRREYGEDEGPGELSDVKNDELDSENDLLLRSSIDKAIKDNPEGRKIYKLAKLLEQNKHNATARIKLSRYLQPFEARCLLLAGRNNTGVWLELLCRFYTKDLLEEALSYKTTNSVFYETLFYAERAILFGTYGGLLKGNKLSNQKDNFCWSNAELSSNAFELYEPNRFNIGNEHIMPSIASSGTRKSCENPAHDIGSSMTIRSTKLQEDPGIALYRLIRVLDKGTEYTDFIRLVKLKLFLVKDKHNVICDALKLIREETGTVDIKELIDLYTLIEVDSKSIEETFIYLGSKGVTNAFMLSRCLDNHKSSLFQHGFRFTMEVLQVSGKPCKIPSSYISKEDVVEYISYLKSILPKWSIDKPVDKNHDNLHVTEKEYQSTDLRLDIKELEHDRGGSYQELIHAHTDEHFYDHRSTIFLFYVQPPVNLKLKSLCLKYMTSLPTFLESFFLSSRNILDSALLIECYSIIKNFVLTYEFITEFLNRRTKLDYLFKAKEIYKLFLMTNEMEYFWKAESALMKAWSKYRDREFILAVSKMYYNAKNYIKAYFVLPPKLHTIKKYVTYANIDRVKCIQMLEKDIYSYKRCLLYLDLLVEEGVDVLDFYRRYISEYKNEKVAYIRYLKIHRVDIAHEESEKLIKMWPKCGDLWYEKYVVHKKIGKVSLKVLYEGRRKAANERVMQEIKYLENKEVIKDSLEIFYIYRRLRKKSCNKDVLCISCAEFMIKNIKELLMVQNNGDLYILWYLVNPLSIEEIKTYWHFCNHRHGFYWPRSSRIVDLKSRLEAGAELMIYDIT